jgi:hypothetical protein
MGVVSFDFAVEAFVFFYEFSFLFISVGLSHTGSVDIYGISSLGGGASPSAMTVVISVLANSKGLNISKRVCLLKSLENSFFPLDALQVGLKWISRRNLYYLIFT